MNPNKKKAWRYLLPAALFLVCFLVYPLIDVFVYSVEERNTILGLQNIVRKVYVEVVERNNELAALRNYTTGAPVVAATTKSLQEGARVRTAG